MKTINEKAEKHLSSVYAGYDDVLKKLVKESYVSGANYVLDEIEEFMKHNLVYGGNLERLIEQLKKLMEE